MKTIVLYTVNCLHLFLKSGVEDGKPRYAETYLFYRLPEKSRPLRVLCEKQGGGNMPCPATPAKKTQNLTNIQKCTRYNIQKCTTSNIKNKFISWLKPSGWRGYPLQPEGLPVL